MPIKAKPIDPGRARLAALGQWNRQRATTAIGPNSAKRRGSSSCDDSTGSSTSTSSSEGSRTGRRGRRRLCIQNGKRDGNCNGGAPAFLTSSRTVGSDSGTSNSDPELYRAARERTERFLYPNGRSDINVSSSNQGAVMEDRRVATSNAENISFDFSLPMAPVAPVSSGLQSQNPRKESDSNKGDANLESSHKISPPTPAVAPLVVQEALRGLQGTTDSASEREFARLMELFAADIQKEREQEKELQQEKELKVDTMDPISLMRPKNQNQKPAQGPWGETSSLYTSPPRTFDELQERALLRLYAANEENKDSGYFIATDHMAEAFTLAALEAARNESPGDTDAASGASGALNDNNEKFRPIGAPPSLMEIVALERARRNARAAFQKHREGEAGMFIDSNAEALLSMDTEVLAATAAESLNRFLLAVRCIENAVRNRRVTNALGRFLFAHHKPFLRTTRGAGSSADAIREFPHEAFAVYERYGRYVSKFITELLNRNVPNFNMEEFVLSLFDEKMDGEENNNASDAEDVSMDVLSYPAWRLLQSISSFDEFCTFMDDFIAEEYGVEKVIAHDNDDSNGVAGVKTSRCDEDGVVVVAGARGVRALLTKTKAKLPSVRASSTCDASQQMRIPNEDAHDSNDAFLFLPSEGGVTETPLSSPPRESQVHGDRAATEFGTRTDSAPTVLSNSHPAVFGISRAPFGNSSTPPSAASLQGPRPSRNSLSTANSLPQLPQGRRRIDAVRGRNLPPLSPVGGTEAETMFFTAPLKLSLGSEATAVPPGGFKTEPVTTGRTVLDTDSSGKTDKASGRQASSPSTGVSYGRKKKSKDSRSRSGARTGAETTTKTTKPRGKQLKSSQDK
ncbi:hypothetical protein MOQ_004809 [Trypanosoma cruzi marinkellei]|uniref:Uncharacterized protein n=1 Tax=Trypanosoma cruzi marinkellei TaxID=85056 RepID=K2MW51_TRYCR|nr:hypothetical protein MOQ_004809 [Trypanosoma cruzi marinkellei]